MKKQTTHNKGFAMVYIMLILAAVILATSLAISNIGILSGKRMQKYSQSAEARMLAMHCSETVLLLVRTTPTLTTASTTITQGTGSCVYSVTGTSPNKTINVIATKYNLYKKVQILVTRMSPSILAAWVEVK